MGSVPLQMPAKKRKFGVPPISTDVASKLIGAAQTSSSSTLALMSPNSSTLPPQEGKRHTIGIYINLSDPILISGPNSPKGKPMTTLKVMGEESAGRVTLDENKKKPTNFDKGCVVKYMYYIFKIYVINVFYKFHSYGNI